MGQHKSTDNTIAFSTFTAAELREHAEKQQEKNKKLAKEALINIITEKITKDANEGYFCSTFSYADFVDTHCMGLGIFKMIRGEVFAMYKKSGFEVKPVDDRWEFMISW